MTPKNQVALITGSARRVGAAIATTLHASGYRVIIHYRHSEKEARALSERLNKIRKDTANYLVADLDNHDHYHTLIDNAMSHWGQLDVLINNASTFFATPISKATEQNWHQLMNSNLKAPFFLSQAAAPHLKKQRGCIINITDIYAKKPMARYPIYSCAKAGLSMLTQALALELAPEIRVNAIAPGCVIWPEGGNTYSEIQKKQILKKTLLHKQVTPEDIANTALFLANQSAITGETITVDAGRL